eukprot:1425799-Pleurochrysis_carterae.AAC.4
MLCALLCRHQGIRAVVRLHGGCARLRCSARRRCRAHLVALDDGGGEDGHDVQRELGDVLGDADEHARGREVVAQLAQRLDQHVRVEQHQVVRQLLRRARARRGVLMRVHVSMRVRNNVPARACAGVRARA